MLALHVGGVGHAILKSVSIEAFSEQKKSGGMSDLQKGPAFKWGGPYTVWALVCDQGELQRPTHPTLQLG